MQRLGELLQLLYGAHAKVETVELTVVDRLTESGSLRLRVENDADGTPHIVPPRRSVTGRGAQTTRRIWRQGSSRSRVEVYVDGRLTRVGIKNGSRWSRWDVDAGTATGDVFEAVVPPLLRLPLLVPAELLSAVWLEPGDLGTRAGRKVRSARARPRNPDDGAELALEFDFEHGTILRHAVLQGGRIVRSTEATDVIYDAPLDGALFEIDNPATSLESVSPRDLPLRGVTIWITGRPGAGKSTLAEAIRRQLERTLRPACVIDGDEVRAGLSEDLDLSANGRHEQARRVAHTAAMVAKANITPIVALVSPYRADRQRAREIHEQERLGFIEVWLDAPIAVCEARDSKGLYARARAGEISDLTGLGAPYEEAPNADVYLRSDQVTADTAARRVVAVLARITQSHVAGRSI